MRVEQIRTYNPTKKSPAFQHTSSDFYILTGRMESEKNIKRYIRDMCAPWYKKPFYRIKDFFEDLSTRKKKNKML